LSRWRVQDGGSFNDGFTVTDMQTNTTTQIDYGFVGTDTNASTTWDFAPLCEMREVEGNNFNQFRTQLHQDDQFVERQVMMNRRHAIYQTRSETAGTISNGLHMYSGTFTDPVDGQKFWLSSDVRYGRNKPPLSARIGYHIPTQKIKWPLLRAKHKINKVLKLNRSPEEILREHAERKSKQLLKQWLSEKEYNDLMQLGEMEIYNDDEIYIVRKSPGATVTVKKNGKQDEFCLITEKLGYAMGDILLTKIMMLKTDPEHFKKVAIKR